MKNASITFILTLGVFVTAGMPSLARADYWGAAYGATLLERGMEEAFIKIQNAMLGAAKQAAIESINQTVGNLIAGTNQKPRFITDWNDALFLSPQREAELFVNDFLTSVTRGRSTGNYNTLLGQEGISGGYEEYLASQAYASVFGSGGTPTINARDYCTDPSQPFADGTWRCFNALVSNPLNNSIGLSLVTQGVYQAELEQKQKVAEAQSIAYGGYNAVTTDGGQVITPGSTVRDIQYSAIDTANKTLSSAKSVEELITAVATRFIVTTMTQGIGSARETAEKNSTTQSTSTQAVPWQNPDAQSSTGAITGGGGGF